jgi:hemolysin activation/secretion protein
MRSVRVPCVLLTASVFGGQAFGQVPPSASPDRLDDRFKPIEAPESVPEKALPAATAITPSDQNLGTTFNVSTISIDGSTVFLSTDFDSLTSALAGKTVTLRDLYRARDSVTSKYRAAGYTLSQAIIPAQNLESGTVHIQVVEGYIDKINFEGDASNASWLFARTADKIKASRPLQQVDLERYISLLNDLPGVTASTVLKPSLAMPAAADMTIIIKRKPISANISFDNLGSLAIGPVEATASVELNNLLGLNDQTSLLFATALPVRSLRYFAISHSETLSSEGLRLTVSASNSLSKPGGAISALSARGTGTVVSAFLRFPIIRTRAKTLRFEAGLTYQNSQTDLLTALYSKDKVRVGTVRASYDVSDNAFSTSASTLLQVEVSHGFDIFGATKSGSSNLSRVNGKSNFTLISGELTRIQNLHQGVSLAIFMSGQYAFDPLLSSQQFGLGGRRFGRGYEPSELTGDNGIGVSIEPRIDLPLNIPKTKVQAYAYYDLGRVWTKTPLVGQLTSQNLSSAGVGLRARIGPHISASIELAKPLTRDISARANRNVRPFFSLSFSL